MRNYHLSTLLTLRENKKISADVRLKQAIEQHLVAENKLSEIEMLLKNHSLKRAHLQNKFFTKARFNPYNKREIICHESTTQKNIKDESALKTELLCQRAQVNNMRKEIEIARNSVMIADQNLKIVKKHYDVWQQQLKRTDERKSEYETDERNCLNYVTKKA